MESHLQLTGEHSRIAMVGIDRRCPRLGLCSARQRDGRGELAASAHVHLGLPLRVIERQQIADVSVRGTLRQFGQHVQQPGVWLDAAGAACQHQAVDHRARLRAGNRVAEQPRFAGSGKLVFILPISGKKLKSIIVGIRCMVGALRFETSSNAAAAASCISKPAPAKSR